MKILLLGDNHVCSSRLQLMSKLCNEILSIIDSIKPDYVANLGDSVNFHSRLELDSLVFATKFMKEIAKRCPLYLLIGNHDRMNNSDFMTDCHPFIGLKEHPNITVVDKAIWDKKLNMIFVPYVANGRFNEALSTVGYYPFVNGQVNLKQEHPYFIFAHQEFNGCLLGVKASSNGDQWSSMLGKILSGHVHKYHILGNVTYVGTFYQTNFGEDTDKAIMLLNIEDQNGQIQVINPNDDVKIPKYTVERIRLKSAPIKTTIHLNYADLDNFESKIPINTEVKVYIHVDATQTASLELNPRYQALKAMVAKVVPKVEGGKASLAETMVKEYKHKGSLNSEKKIFKVEEIVLAMIKDDEYTTNIFNKEIIN